MQHADEFVHAARVLRGDGFGDFGMIVAVGGGVLDGEELAGIAVVLHIAVSLDEQRVADHEAAAPAGHVEILAGRVQLDADVFRARRGEEAQRFVAVVNQADVGGVVDDDEVVRLGEVDDLGEERRCGTRAGRVVRIVQHEHLGLGQHVGRDAVEVWQIIVLRRQCEVVHLAAVIFCVRAKHRIAGGGHDDGVAGIDEGSRQNGERRLAANGVEHFRVGVDAADAADVVDEPGGGFLERLAAVIGVTAVSWVLGLLVEFGHDLGERHFVRFADAHVDDLGAGVGLKHGVFGALDLLEFVDGGVFAVVDAADTFRE